MIKKIKKQTMKSWIAAHHSYNQAMDQAPPRAKKILRRSLLAIAVLLFAIVFVKWTLVKKEERVRAAEIAAGPQIRVTKVGQSPGGHNVILIGETRPYAEATLYAKVSGYLKSVNVDKGDVVKEGQILAVIESPETDQAYEATKADARNKVAVAKRMDLLFTKKLVSQQEFDQSRADSDIASARLRAEETLKSYKTIRAPFAGTVTSRFADPGALVQNATNAQTSALPLVTVSTINRLRVDVFVDQHDAAYVAKDAPVEITTAERPGFKVLGKVSRVSGELDPRTKMLLTEIDLENDKKDLVAGSFVSVSLKVDSPPYLQAPVESLVLKNDKTFLTVVTPSNQITFKAVNVINNDGKMILIASGVNVGDTVALNVSDTIPEGGKVRPLVEGDKPK